MASIVYNVSRKEIADQTLDLLGDTLKVMLVDSGYTPDPDHLVVDAGGANDPVDHEISVTGYTAGWGGSGRKTLTTKAIAADNTNDRAKLTADPVDWPSLATGATIRWALLIKEGGANDTTSRLIAAFDVGSIPTNGGEVEFTFPSTGLIWF